MAYASRRFRLVVPLIKTGKLQQYGSLNVFVGPDEVLFMAFCQQGEPSHAASTRALDALKRHCIQNNVAFQLKSLFPSGRGLAPKPNTLALKLASVPSGKA